MRIRWPNPRGNICSLGVQRCPTLETLQISFLMLAIGAYSYQIAPWVSFELYYKYLIPL